MSRIKSLPNEVWKPVMGYEGFYDVSNKGRVRSWHQVKNGRMLNPNDKDGYLRITLCSFNGRKRACISILVWEHFGNKKLDGRYFIVAHRNGDYRDNRIENLFLMDNHQRGVLKDWKDKASKYTGVYYSKALGKWKSSVSKYEDTINLGYFETEEDAHAAYLHKIDEIRNDYEGGKRKVDYEAESTFEYNEIQGERWLSIIGYEGIYEISNMGRVKSLHGKGRISPPKSITNKTRPSVTLSAFGTPKTLDLSTLVWDYFGDKKRDGIKLIVTHINRDVTDNRIVNLELITQRQKSLRTVKGKNTSSKYIGVSKHKKTGRWKSVITVNGKAEYLGYFSKEIDASNAYQKRLAEIRGTV